MTDTKGDSPVDTPPVEPKDEPKVDVKDDKQDTPDDLPEQYKGKSLKELAGILQEKEKYIGTQGEQIGTLKQDVSYLQGLQEQAKEKPEEKPQEYGFTNEEWEAPKKIIDERAEQIARKIVAERDEAEARQLYIGGMNRAMREKPELFKGREQEIQWLMNTSYQQGNVPKYKLGDSNFWIETATAYKGAMDAVGPKTGQSLDAVPGEKPVATKSGTDADAVPVSSSMREWMDSIKQGEKGKNFDEAKVIKRTKKALEDK